MQPAAPPSSCGRVGHFTTQRSIPSQHRHPSHRRRRRARSRAPAVVEAVSAPALSATGQPRSDPGPMHPPRRGASFIPGVVSPMFAYELRRREASVLSAAHTPKYLADRNLGGRNFRALLSENDEAGTMPSDLEVRALPLCDCHVSHDPRATAAAARPSLTVLLHRKQPTDGCAVSRH